MAYLPVEAARNHCYLNVADGVLRRRMEGGIKEDFGGFVGTITGLRVKPDSYNGKPFTKLEMRMQDLRNPDEPAAIISMTLYTGDGEVTTFSRMLVARLVNRANDIKRGDELEISVYARGQASCAALRRRGQEEALPGEPMFTERKHDRKNLRVMMDKAIAKLIEIHGVFGTQDTDPRDEETEPEPPMIDDEDLPF